jgi:taurine dioxygenase
MSVMAVDFSEWTDAELLQKTRLSFTRLSKNIGVEVGGIDLSARLAKPSFELIRRAWLKHGVLVFRDQKLGPDQIIAFSARFGDLYRAPIMDNGRTFVEEYPELFVISNVMEKGERVGSLGARELAWHTDMSYLSSPPKASCLYAVEVPKSEGRTGFLNMYRAYTRLRPELKAQIRDIAIKHDTAYTLDGFLREGCGVTLDRVKAKGTFDVRILPGPWHPAVLTHPETERKVLFVGRRQNTCVQGMWPEESEALLDTIWKYINRIGRRAYHHEWQVGDLVMWDNRSVMLRRDMFPGSSRRILYRTQIQDSVPE